VRTRLFLAIFTLSAGLHSPCFGFAFGGSAWTPNRTVVMHLNLPIPDPICSATPTPCTDGFASLSASAEDALNTWNQYLNHMHFVVDPNSSLPPSGTDGDTSVSMSSTVYGKTFGGALAVTVVTSSAVNAAILVECDVIFNKAIEWGSYRGHLGSAIDFHRVALHEFGHVVGLDHPDQAKPKQIVAAIMNSVVGDVDKLQPDDIAGGKSIYDNGPAYTSGNPAPNLLNLSTRAFVGTGERTLIGGFIIQGTQPATLLLRAIGNSLRAVGIANTLHDPFMELHDSKGIVATSDDWISDSDASAIASYRLDPPNSQESAILATLNPGNYTFVVQSYPNPNSDLTGTAVVELYDLHTTGGRAGNISSRGQVLTGDNILIGGFIIGGSQNKSVVVRALGPSLSGAGIANPLANPNLELRDVSGNLLAGNDDWGNGPDAALIQSEGFAPSQSVESALQATLAPGNYTAIVRGVNSTGIGLVEIYDLSPAPN